MLVAGTSACTPLQYFHEKPCPPHARLFGIKCLQGAITIKQAKKDLRCTLKIVKIGEIFMFYHLEPWQSWQVGPFSFI
jgi:hypothetical protein